MRDYKLVAQRVFQRRDEYLLAKKRKKQLIWKYTAIPVGLCFLIVAGTGYQNLKRNSSELETLEQETTDFIDSDTQETESKTVSDSLVQTDTQMETEYSMTTEKNNTDSESISEQTVSVSEYYTETVTEPTEEITSQTVISDSENRATFPPMTEFPTDVIVSDTIPEPTIPITEQTDPVIDTLPAVQPNDYRITVEAFEPTPEQLSNVIQQTIPSNFEYNYTTLEQLFQDAGATIACKVLSVVNTLRDNEPYTVYTVEVTDSIYGSFVKGDLLSIVQYGGYILQSESNSIVPPSCVDPDEPGQNIPSNDYVQSEVLVEEQLAYSETPSVSQEYILFISPDSLFNGAYATLNQNEGMFKVNPETGELIRNAEQGEDINSSLSCDTVKQVGGAFVNSTN